MTVTTTAAGHHSASLDLGVIGNCSIAALIVHYHGGPSIRACARSLLAGTRVPDRVVVIDNGSDPGWHAGFTHEFPDVVVVRSPRNLGFAGALPATVAHDALGAARSEGALLILNQDAEVGPTCVARLEEALRHPSIGIACPLVLDHHGRIWARGGAIDPITARARNVVPATPPKRSVSSSKL